MQCFINWTALKQHLALCTKTLETFLHVAFNLTLIECIVLMCVLLFQWQWDPVWNDGPTHPGYHSGLSINSSSPRQNGHHFTDNIFKCIFVNENSFILIQISLKFVPKGLIDNKSTLVQFMSWRRTGDMPLPEPMLPSSLTYIRH